MQFLFSMSVRLPCDPSADDGCNSSWYGDNKGYHTINAKPTADLVRSLADASRRGGRTG